MWKIHQKIWLISLQPLPVLFQAFPRKILFDNEIFELRDLRAEGSDPKVRPEKDQRDEKQSEKQGFETSQEQNADSDGGDSKGNLILIVIVYNRRQPFHL
jgi:hypothetical protein